MLFRHAKILFATASLSIAASNLVEAGAKLPHHEIVPTLIVPVLQEWEAKHCLAKYNREVEKSKELLAKNGSMTEFFYAQRQLRRKYFDLDPDRMVYEQMYIDVWESFDIGEINLDTAMNYTTIIMKRGYDSSNEKMKNCLQN